MRHLEVFIGQIVSFHSKGSSGPLVIGKVTKVNPKNIKVLSTDGRTWTVHPSLLSPSTEEFTLDTSKTFSLGEVVRDTGSLSSKGLLVVIKVRSDSTLNVATLGGSPRGVYYSGVPSARLEKVEFSLEGV